MIKDESKLEELSHEELSTRVKNLLWWRRIMTKSQLKSFIDSKHFPKLSEKTKKELISLLNDQSEDKKEDRHDSYS